MSVPAAKRALVAALEERPALDGVLVQIGLPAKIPREQKRIYLTGTRDWRRDIEGGIVHELYDLPLLVEVHTVGRQADRDDAEQTLWGLVAEVDATLREDEELGGAVWEALLTAGDEETNPTTDGWISRASVRVSVRVRSG